MISEHGYSATGVAERLNVSQHSIHKWLKVYSLYVINLRHMNCSKQR
ncbi:hypothetical protein H9629_14850 [Acinetobacter sp. Sa1BUA6]|uniref:Helix-turn-helix domain-containing protein n=1 Tax=Acinetobacter pecorum TaxID=2762215 RepID=A0ABR8W0R8_9GAMM|nr:hypothetical protein [Acinetobacter pecorum]